MAISEKFHDFLWNIRCDIFGRKIKVKKINKINIFRNYNILKNLRISPDRENCRLSFDVYNVYIL